MVRDECIGTYMRTVLLVYPDVANNLSKLLPIPRSPKSDSAELVIVGSGNAPTHYHYVDT